MNKVMLIGNVGKDPEVRYYGADQAVAKVSLATRERGYELPNGTKVPDRTDWHSLVFYRRLAIVVEKYVRKGDKLYVEGKLQYSKYTDKKGLERQKVEIIVDSMEMLSPKTTATPTDGGSGNDSKQSASNEAPTTTADKRTTTPLPFDDNAFNAPNEEKLPF